MKIADFGLASSWPAPKGIDGEGDRHYLAPEALCGRFDKPADIFAQVCGLCPYRSRVLRLLLMALAVVVRYRLLVGTLTVMRNAFRDSSIGALIAVKHHKVSQARIQTPP